MFPGKAVVNQTRQYVQTILNSACERRYYQFYDILVIALVLLIAGGMPTTLVAATQPTVDIRTVGAVRKFDDTFQHSVVFHSTSPAWMRATRMDFAIGAIAQSEDTSAFISYGPVWRKNAHSRPLYTEFGFSPTLLDGTVFGDQDMGGHIHFTSSLSVGMKLGRLQRSELAFRIQHISNGGLADTNPGMDMVGLNIRINFSKR